MRSYVVLASVLVVLASCGLRAEAQTESPSASPSASPLPEIGRTKTRPLCIALRTGAAPILLAVKTGDRAFADARPLMVASLADDAASNGFTAGDGRRQAQLAKIADTMGAQVKAIRDAMNLPELRGVTNGEGLRGEAKALVDLRYVLGTMLETEEFQTNAVSSFVQLRQRNALEGGSELDRSMSSALGASGMPKASGLGMPSYGTHRMPLHESHQLDTWIGDVVATTAAREAIGADVVVAAAALCR